MPGGLADVLQALAATPVAAYLRTSTVAYATLNAAHIFSFGLLVGSIATLDLRLLGLFRAFPLPALAPPLSRMAAVGVLLAAATGFLLFGVRPVAYAQNPAFLLKITLVALGVANALILRFNRGWRIALDGGPVSRSVRIAAALSLLIWAWAVLSGRWIGFLQ
jgi:hypothetical protein